MAKGKSKCKHDGLPTKTLEFKKGEYYEYGQKVPMPSLLKWTACTKCERKLKNGMTEITFYRQFTDEELFGNS